MTRPRIMLDVRFFHSDKIVGLANRYKLGWISLLMEAKQQDREGVFKSRAGLLMAAGVFRDGAPIWFEAGLLHPIEEACPRCAKVYAGVAAGSIVVHDWHDYQVSRTTAWRDDNGLGKAGLQQPGNVSETPGETEVKHPSRAHVRGSRSLSSSDVSPTNETRATDDSEPDPWEAFRGRTGQIPGKKLGGWLNDLSAKHGDTAVSAAIASEPLGGRIPPDYLRAIEAGLTLAARRAERDEAADEVRRNAEKRRPVPIRPVPEEVSDEEAARIAAEYRTNAGGVA